MKVMQVKVCSNQNQTNQARTKSVVIQLKILLRPVYLGTLKVLFATFLLVCFERLKESACKIRKNVFDFTLKALFILEIFKF